MTFFEFQKRFPNEGAALNFIVATKYANGYYCPKCGCFHKGIYRSNKRTKVKYNMGYETGEFRRAMTEKNTKKEE